MMNVVTYEMNEGGEVWDSRGAEIDSSEHPVVLG